MDRISNAVPLPVNATIGAAASYLLDARSPDLLWRDFRTLAGEACDWVSGWVAFAAGSSGLLREATREAVHALLRRQRRSGGWAYNEQVPPDCDSTSWVLLALATQTIWKPSLVLRALAYVLRHETDDGFATYRAEDGIERFIGATPHGAEGWRRTHPCVTAVATHALLLHGLAANLRVRAAVSQILDAQGASGLWTSYWWQGTTYATAQSLRTLAAAQRLSADVWHRATIGLLGQQHPSGGFGDGREPHAFATAMALTALLTRPDRECDEAIDAAARWLVETQRGGCWNSAPILRIPRPTVADPDTEPFADDALGTGVIVRDQRSVFTTAAAMAALAGYHAHIAARSAGPRA